MIPGGNHEGSMLSRLFPPPAQHSEPLATADLVNELDPGGF